MSFGLVGQKCGMTRIFNDDGSAVAVSVVHVQANRVTQVKTVERDGYSAIQVTSGQTKRSKLTKPLAGHYAKVGVEAGRGLREIRLTEKEKEYATGAEIGIEIFQEGEYVDVQGISIGKGFAGVVKRHNFRTQDATHGNSLSHRAPGSIGQNQTPGRVFKGKKMAGHLGNRKTTVQSLKVIKIDTDRSLLMIKGAIPGPKGGTVFVKSAIKK